MIAICYHRIFLLLREIEPIDLGLRGNAVLCREGKKDITRIGIGILTVDCYRLPGIVFGKRYRTEDLVADTRFVNRERAARTLYAKRQCLFVVSKKRSVLGKSAVLIDSQCFFVGADGHAAQLGGAFGFHGFQSVDGLVLLFKIKRVKIEVTGI